MNHSLYSGEFSLTISCNTGSRVCSLTKRETEADARKSCGTQGIVAKILLYAV